MIVTELRQPIAVVTKLGKGHAILIETGSADQYWTVALLNGAIVTFPQSRIRIAKAYTYDRISDEEMIEIIK